RQDALVQHVGIAQDDVAFGTHGRARILWRVAVIGENADFAGQIVGPFHQVIELVVGQGFGRIEVEGSSNRVLKDTLQHRQVVAKRLARSGGRNDHHILPIFGKFKGSGLMRVKLRNSPAFQCRSELRLDPGRKVYKPRLSRWDVMVPGYGLVPLELAEKIAQRGWFSNGNILQCQLGLGSHAFRIARPSAKSGPGGRIGAHYELRLRSPKLSQSDNLTSTFALIWETCAHEDTAHLRRTLSNKNRSAGSDPG